MQFDSSENEEEMVDAQSFTTGSSAAPKNTYKKRPMIQEIASVDFTEEEKDDLKEEDVRVGHKRLFKEKKWTSLDFTSQVDFN